MRESFSFDLLFVILTSAVHYVGIIYSPVVVFTFTPEMTGVGPPLAPFLGTLCAALVLVHMITGMGVVSCKVPFLCSRGQSAAIAVPSACPSTVQAMQCF